MSTRPNPSHPSSDATGAFPGMGAGLGFFQDWMKAASSALPNLGAGAATGGGAPGWTVPTLDPEELDKRIQELKTVQFWLEQNARMLGMTIQTMEVQRMTLQTLKGMQVPMDALRESLRVRPQADSSAAPAAGHADPQTPHAAASGVHGDAPPEATVNPMQWWSTLTEQFSTLASQAVQAGQDAMAQSPGTLTEAVKAQQQAAMDAAAAAVKANTASVQGKPQPAARAPRKPPASKPGKA